MGGSWRWPRQWPLIGKKQPSLPDADYFRDVDGKHEKFFSPLPGGQG
ncbi:DUF3470 domain-containing protein [Pseudonocardia sp.]